MQLAITGTPGTGKSRLADFLGKRLGWQVIHLSQFVEQKKLYSGWDKKRKCWIVDEKMLKREIKKIKNKNLIIEGHFSHIIPSDMVFVLRVCPTKLRKRLERRGWLKSKIEENIEAEIMEVCKTEAKEICKNVFEIDTTNKSIKIVADEIIKIISLTKSRERIC